MLRSLLASQPKAVKPEAIASKGKGKGKQRAEEVAPEPPQAHAQWRLLEISRGQVQGGQPLPVSPPLCRRRRDKGRTLMLAVLAGKTLCMALPDPCQFDRWCSAVRELSDQAGSLPEAQVFLKCVNATPLRDGGGLGSHGGWITPRQPDSAEPSTCAASLFIGLSKSIGGCAALRRKACHCGSPWPIYCVICCRPHAFLEDSACCR